MLHLTNIYQLHLTMESKTNKGGSCLIFENNKFRRYHQGKTKVTWRCTIKKCTAKVHTNNGDHENTVLQSDVQHTHDDTVHDIQAHLLREACKKNTCLTSKPEAVICQQLCFLSPDDVEQVYTTTLLPLFYQF